MREVQHPKIVHVQIANHGRQRGAVPVPSRCAQEVRDDDASGKRSLLNPDRSLPAPFVWHERVRATHCRNLVLTSVLGAGMPQDRLSHQRR